MANFCLSLNTIRQKNDCLKHANEKKNTHTNTNNFLFHTKDKNFD